MPVLSVHPIRSRHFHHVSFMLPPQDPVQPEFELEAQFLAPLSVSKNSIGTGNSSGHSWGTKAVPCATIPLAVGKDVAGSPECQQIVQKFSSRVMTENRQSDPDNPWGPATKLNRSNRGIKPTTCMIKCQKLRTRIVAGTTTATACLKGSS